MQMMRKLTLLTGALLVTVFALTAGLATPRAAHAVCFCDPNEMDVSTGTLTGHGSTCSAATTDLNTQLLAVTNASCGTPIKTCVDSSTTGSCTTSGGVASVPGSRLYKCKVC
jgi:hypothetical protein